MKDSLHTENTVDPPQMSSMAGLFVCEQLTAHCPLHSALFGAAHCTLLNTYQTQRIAHYALYTAH